MRGGLKTDPIAKQCSADGGGPEAQSGQTVRTRQQAWELWLSQD